MLTAEEMMVIDHLAQAWNAFLTLPEQHRDDVNDFRFHIHAAQAKILARSGRRDLKEHFSGYEERQRLDAQGLS